MSRFQLSPADLSVLKSGVVCQEMFDALVRTEQIHTSCKLLMQVGCQTVASDIMEQMTMYQASTYYSMIS